MKPKGTLLLIGGGEDKGDPSLDYRFERNKYIERYEILNELLVVSKQRIEIITTGSKVQEKVKRDYQKVFRRIGYRNPGFIHINDKIEARDPSYLKRVEDAAAIFFTGGDQFRLASILGGTRIVNIIKRRYQEDADFVVAGTSAGAMVMSSIMIAAGGFVEALIDRDLKISSGLGLIQNCIIDTHFISRGRFGRLAHAVLLNPDQLGIGLGDDTALVITKGTKAECRGSGIVVIMDARYIRQTNIIDSSEDTPLYVENLKVHILVKGCRFSIKDRKLDNPVSPAKKGKKRRNP